MRRAVSIAAITACAAGVAWAAPAGKVVRIERGHDKHNPPVVCEVSDTTGRCFMGHPFVGDEMAIIDPNRASKVVGSAHIASVSEDEHCPDRVWNVVLSYDSLDPASSGSPRAGNLGLANVGMTPEAEVVHDGMALPASAAPNETAAITIDRNGDGHGDLVLTAYPCDPAGVGSGNGNTFCLSVWLDEGHGLTRTSATALEMNCLQ